MKTTDDGCPSAWADDFNDRIAALEEELALTDQIAGELAEHIDTMVEAHNALVRRIQALEARHAT